MSIVERTTIFVQSAWVESKKVTWPSKEELKGSTYVVLASTFLTMLFLFIVDHLLGEFIKIFIG